jgi:hypothetical protein
LEQSFLSIVRAKRKGLSALLLFALSSRKLPTVTWFAVFTITLTSALAFVWHMQLLSANAHFCFCRHQSFSMERKHVF